MEKNRIKNAIVRFWVAPEMDATVRRIADAQERSLSSVYRELVEKGLVAGGYRSGGQDMAELVQNAVEQAMRPQIERLAAISAKGTQIGAAAFFLAAYNGRQQVPEEMQEEYDELAAQARKLGVEYLKLSRDQSLDDFIARGQRRMNET